MYCFYLDTKDELHFFLQNTSRIYSPLFRIIQSSIYSIRSLHHSLWMLEICFNFIASRLFLECVAGVFNIEKVYRPWNFLNSLLPQRAKDLLSTTAAASKLNQMEWFWNLSTPCTPCMENFACGALTIYFYDRCIGYRQLIRFFKN